MILSEQYRPQIDRIRELAAELQSGPNLAETTRLLRIQVNRLIATCKPANENGKHHGKLAFGHPDYWREYASESSRAWRRWGKQTFSAWLATHPGVECGRIVAISEHHYWRDIENGDCDWAWGEFQSWANRVQITQAEYLEWWHQQPNYPDNAFRAEVEQYGIGAGMVEVRVDRAVVTVEPMAVVVPPSNGNGHAVVVPIPAPPPPVSAVTGQWCRVAGQWYYVKKGQVTA